MQTKFTICFLLLIASGFAVQKTFKGQLGVTLGESVIIDEGVYRLTNTEFHQQFANIEGSDVDTSATEQDLWRVARQGNSYTLQSVRTGGYLGAAADKSVYSAVGVTNAESWTVTEQSPGKFCFRNVQRNYFLRVKDAVSKFVVELNDRKACGYWAWWSLEKVTNVPVIFEGSYVVQNNQFGKYLANTNDDLVQGTDYPHVWKVTKESEGVYSLQDQETNNYLRCGTQGEINAVSQNQGEERWTITKQADGVYCLSSVESKKFPRQGNSGENWVVNQQTFCGPWEKWNFISHHGLVDGVYRLRQTEYSKLFANINQDEIETVDNEQDLWRVIRRSDFYTIQSVRSGLFLGAAADNTVYTSSEAGDAEAWDITENKDGNYCVRNVFRNYWLRVRKDGDDFITEMNGRESCGGWAWWAFEKETHIPVFEGEYFIKSNQWGKYLANLEGDAMKGVDSPRVWKVTKESDGVYSLQDVESQNYLRCGTQNDINAVENNAVSEKWYITKEGHGVYCIVNQQHNRWVRLGSAGENFIVNQQTYCGPWEKFNFIHHDGAFIDGVYRLRQTEYSQLFANLNEGDVATSELEQDLWRVARDGDAYTIQSVRSGNFLGAAENNEVYATDSTSDAERWTIDQNDDGNWCVRNVERGYWLRVRKTGSDSYVLELNGRKACGGWAWWDFDMVHSVPDLFEGEYIIQNNQFKRYLANTDGGVVQGAEYPEVWRVLREGENTYSLFDLNSHNYLRGIGNNQVDAVGHNEIWEKWIITKESDGAYCIKNVQYGQWARLGNEGENWVVNQQGHCGPWEKWNFVQHHGQFVDGVYRIRQTLYSKLFVNYFDDFVKATDDEDLWRVVRDGEAYTFQSVRTGNYLSADVDHVVYTTPTVDDAGSWTIQDRGDGTYCIFNNVREQWLRVREAQSNHHIELNEIEVCGNWARWTFEEVHDIPDIFAGDYTIQSNQWQKYVANSNNDVVKGTQFPHVWRVTKESENTYSLLDLDSQQFLRCGTNGEINVVGHNQAWERWIVTKESKGVYCIQNNQHGKWARMGNAGEDFVINQQTHCGPWEKFNFKPHLYDLTQGIYKISNTKWNKLFVNYHDAVVKATNDEDLWVLRRVQGNIYTLQSQRTGRYLIAHDDGSVSTETEATTGGSWLVHEKSDGVFCVKNNDVEQWLRVRNQNDDYHIELNEGDSCGEWARWTFDQVHNPGDIFEGSYVIINNQWNRYLANLEGDNIYGAEYPHAWRIQREGENIFSIQDQTTSNYMRCGTEGEVNAVGHNQGQEKWYVQRGNDGLFCFVNVQHNKWARMGNEGEAYIINQQTYCGPWEKFRLRAVHNDIVFGVYTLTNTDKNVQPAVEEGGENIKSTEQGDSWVVEPSESGHFTIRSTQTGRYLGATKENIVYGSEVAGDQEQWTFNSDGEGAFCIFNVQQQHWLRVRRTKKQADIIELNGVDYCGSWARWKLERTTSFYSLHPGRYVIKNDQFNKYLSNSEGDKLVGSDHKENWIVKYEGDGVYSLQSESTDNFLRCGNQGEINAVGHNLGWEKWFLRQFSDDAWCIFNRQWNKYARMGDEGEGFAINQQTYCGPLEKWTFQAVHHAGGETDEDDFEIYEDDEDDSYVEEDEDVQGGGYSGIFSYALNA